MIKIGARKCIINELTEKDTSEFLNKYHRQKNVTAIYHIGLIYNSILIAVMTFGYPRYNKTYQWELLRLCFHPDYRIIGGTMKMFNYFVDTYKPCSIISYCDYNYFTGDVYDKLNFKLLRISKGSKIWYKNDKFITDNLLRQFGPDKLIGTNDGKGTDNEKIMLREGWNYKIDEKGQGTYIWNGNGKFGYIYLITDTLHNKQYIGQHRGYKLNNNYYGSGKLILSIIKKYGTSILKREIIDYASSQKELSEKEIFYIKKYNTLSPNGYNLTLRVQGIDAYIPHEVSEELKQKRSENAKELWKNEEYKEKISKCRKEMWKNFEHKEKIRISMKERMSKIEEKQKLKDGLSKFLSDETNKKEWNKKRTKATNTIEYRNKLSEAAKGKHWFNNGKISVLRYNIPEGEEWLPGRLYMKNKQF